jgi:hypothetical protein
VTFALGITAPVASLMVPLISALETWAIPGRVSAQQNAPTAKNRNKSIRFPLL